MRYSGTSSKTISWRIALLAIAVIVVGAPGWAEKGPVDLSTESGARRVTGEINNGVSTGGFSSVALFETSDGGTCTATLIGCQTALTAAHCICDSPPCSPKPSYGRLFFQHSGSYPVVAAVVHPSWNPAGLGRHDLALLRLAAPVAGVEPSTLNTLGKPTPGTEVGLVGFGTTSTTPPGIKRSGLAELQACLDGNPAGLCYRFEAPIGPAGEDSTGCPGDSGGPMFANSGVGLSLVGATSGGRGAGSADCSAPVEGVYSDIFGDRNWIQSQAGGDLDQAACGGLPNAGSQDAPSAGWHGSLDASQPGASTTFVVPAGTKALFVTLNAEAYWINDFDLYLHHGSPVTNSDIDCRSESDDSIEACLVVDPQPGIWHILASRYSGQGLFQFTAAAFKASAGDTSPCIQDASTACLQNGRFEAKISFSNNQSSGEARVMSFNGQRAASRDSAFYYFGNSTNFEMGLKVLNACVPAFGNKYWVFISGLTNQGWQVRIRDTTNGQLKTYSNANGQLSETFADTQAFNCN